MNRDRIESVQQRTQRYWYEDGLTEAATGCLFVLVGLLFFVEASAPPGSLLASFSAIGLPVLLVLGFWIGKHAVAFLKERLTYPRTGYVAYRRTPVSRRALTGIVAVVVAALAVQLLRVSQTPVNWIPTLDGVVIGIFLLYMGYKLGLVRFYALAVVSALIGLSAALGGLDETMGSAAYFAGMGVALLVSGGLTLWSYLSQTQPPAEG